MVHMGRHIGSAGDCVTRYSGEPAGGCGGPPIQLLHFGSRFLEVVDLIRGLVYRSHDIVALCRPSLVQCPQEE